MEPHVDFKEVTKQCTIKIIISQGVVAERGDGDGVLINLSEVDYTSNPAPTQTSTLPFVERPS